MNEITPKIRMLCLVLINSIPLNLLSVWIIIILNVVIKSLVVVVVVFLFLTRLSEYF